MSEETIHQTTAKFLKDKREVKGLSQSEVAIRVFGHVNRKDAVSKIEAGKQKITLETLGMFLKAFDSKIDFKEY